MELNKAKKIAGEFIQEISDLVSSVEVVGSVRREQPYPRDLDFVLIPENPLTFKVDFINRFKKSIKQIGNKLIRLSYKDQQIDCYVANKSTWETLKLIRTGSTNHNRKLCMKAINMNLKLKADGTGLIDKNGNIIANTEHSIIETLLGKYIEPYERD